MIRPATKSDAQRISEIYNHYVTGTIVTFEEEPVTAGEMTQRIADVQAQSLPWLVALSEQDDQQLVGYAYACLWKGRSAYRHSTEITVYLAPSAASQGWGSRLYAALFEELKKTPTHAVISGISLPNEASVALHEKFGMTKVAHFPEVGFKLGNWVDVGYWQANINDGD